MRDFNSFLEKATIDEILYIILKKDMIRYNSWAVKNQRCLSAILNPLIWRRDEKGELFNIEDIECYLNLEKITEFLDLTKWSELPVSLRENVNSYLFTLKGWSRKKDLKENINHFTVIQYHCYTENNIKSLLKRACQNMDKLF